jgi:hypothetical protein
MSKLWIYDTETPFGIEKNGGIVYFKVVLWEGRHDFILNAIREREERESKKNNMEVISSLRQLKDKSWLLRLRVKVFKGKMAVKMTYKENEDNYLKSLDEVTSSDMINVRFSLGEGYIFNWEGQRRLGINIYLDEVVV